jgi:hypothetical protein
MEFKAVDYFKNFDKKVVRRVGNNIARANHKSLHKIFDYLNLSVIKHNNQGYLSNIHFTDKQLIKEFKMSKSSYNEKISYLKQAGILIEVNKPSYKSNTSAEYYVKKTEFIINNYLETLFSTFDKSFKRMLSYRNIKLDLKQIFTVLFDTIKHNKPIPLHVSKLHDKKAKEIENTLINYIYSFFFISLDSYFKNNENEFKSINASFHTPILKYYLALSTKRDYLSSIGSQRVQHDVAPSSPLVGAGLWTKKVMELSMVWFLNNMKIGEVDFEINKGKHKYSFKYLESIKNDYIENELVCADDFRYFDLFYLNKMYLSPVSICDFLEKEESPLMLTKEFALHLYNKSNLIKKIEEVNSQLKKYGHNYPIDLNVSITAVQEKDKHLDELALEGYEYKATTRNWSPFDFEEKKMRATFLKDNWGAVDSFDFKSCSFALVRLLNTRKFDVNWGLKELIVNRKFPIQYKEGVYLERKDLRSLLYLIFNKKTPNIYDVDNIIKAINADRAEKRKNPLYLREYPDLSRETLLEIIGLIHHECGNWTSYTNNIFFLESLLEMMIKLEMNELGYYVENIYDCFYFNPQQITHKKFTNLVKKTTKQFYKLIGEYCPEIQLGSVLHEPELEKKYIIYTLKALSWSKHPTDYSSFTFKNRNLEEKSKYEDNFAIDDGTRKKIYNYLDMKSVANRWFDKTKGYMTYSVSFSGLADLLTDAVFRDVIQLSDITKYINRIIKYQSFHLDNYDIKDLNRILTVYEDAHKKYTLELMNENLSKDNFEDSF